MDVPSPTESVDGNANAEKMDLETRTTTMSNALLWIAVGFGVVVGVCCGMVMMARCTKKRKEREHAMTTNETGIEMKEHKIRISPFGSSPQRKVNNSSLHQNIMAGTFDLDGPEVVEAVDSDDDDDDEVIAAMETPMDPEDEEVDGIENVDDADEYMVDEIMQTPNGDRGDLFGGNLKNGAIAGDVMMDEIIGHMATPDGDHGGDGILSYADTR